MAWFKKRGDIDPPDGSHGPLNDKDPGDWVVVPFRVLEAARISIATIGSHPDIPDYVRMWIAQWLMNYNAVLSHYFQETYGPNIFGVLERITDEVKASAVKVQVTSQDVAAEDFEMWKQEWDRDE